MHITIEIFQYIRLCSSILKLLCLDEKMFKRLITRVVLANNCSFRNQFKIINNFKQFSYRTPLLVSNENERLRRLAIAFTCKVCNERMTRTFLKKSYEEGVVLIRCTKCLNNHIIADNLGWFSDLNGKKFV
jgi:hypothetical protein